MRSVSVTATSVRLSGETAEKLERLAEETGRSKSFYLRQAIESSIDQLAYEYGILADLEDVRRGRLATVSLDDFEASLDLDD